MCALLPLAVCTCMSWYGVYARLYARVHAPSQPLSPSLPLVLAIDRSDTPSLIPPPPPTPAPFLSAHYIFVWLAPSSSPSLPLNPSPSLPLNPSPPLPLCLPPYTTPPTSTTPKRPTRASRPINTHHPYNLCNICHLKAPLLKGIILCPWLMSPSGNTTSGGYF